jgi:hypothetical protein
MSEKKYSREILIQAAWHKGRLDYKLHSAQMLVEQKFNENTNMLFVGNLARQTGKTYWAVKKAEEIARTFPGSQIRYGAAFQSDLLDYIIPAFHKIEEDCPLQMRSRYLKAGSRIEFGNGSVIKLVGLDKNPDGLRGNTLDLIILDEVGFTSQLDYIYKSIIVPATMHRPKAKVIMISTPPSTPAHDFCDYVQKAQLEGGYIELTIDQNPRVNAETRARLVKESGGEHTTTWQREYLCKFVVDSDLQLIPEWKDEFVQSINRDEYHTYYHKYVGMDLGRLDHTALIFGHYDFKRASLIIEDELVLVGADWTTETLKDSLLKKEEELWGEQKPFRRISDNNNPHLIIDLQHLHQVNFQETNKESLEAMVNEVRLLVSEGRILINPKCQMLIGCLKYGVWDKNRKEFARSKTYGHFDMLAALIYTVRNLSKGINPIPADHGFEAHKAWLGNISKETSNQKAIKNMFSLKRTL